jgi:hypothetical protein
MQKFNFSEISLKDLKKIVALRQKGIADYSWTQVEKCQIAEEEKSQLSYITNHTKHYPAHIMNEATLWARLIYPLLQLAERDDILATSEVGITAQYAKFELNGILDGVLGKCIAGNPEVPYLVILEAKRGLENTNPQPQLYSQLLATARLNQEDENNNQAVQEIFGCYTVADVWTFVRAEISEMDSDHPMMMLEHSKEYSENLEAEMILKMLKSIVGNYTHQKYIIANQ